MIKQIRLLINEDDFDLLWESKYHLFHVLELINKNPMHGWSHRPTTNVIKWYINQIVHILIRALRQMRYEIYFNPFRL